MMFPLFQKYSLYKETECIVSYNTLTTNIFDNNKIENMSNKQTAVEWLIDQLTETNFLWLSDKPEMNELIKIIEQAKVMEKEQIVDAYNEDLYGGLSGHKKFDDGEQYYNETFNK